MDYLVTDFENREHKFSFSYRAIKEDYLKIKEYTDEQFLNNIPEILHTTVLICYFKEIPSSICLSDLGIIHELIHLLNKIESPYVTLSQIRKMWDFICQL